jgi:hypothetical protein
VPAQMPSASSKLAAPPTNENVIAIGALKRKRAELAGLIVAAEKQVADLRADLVHIDNALRIMNSPDDPALIPARKPRQRNKGSPVPGDRRSRKVRRRPLLSVAYQI